MTAAVLPLPAPAASTVARCAGRMLMVSGACFGAANLFQWAVTAEILPLHPAALSLSWPVAVGAFLIMIRKVRREGGEAGRQVAGWSRLIVLSQLGGAVALAAASGLTGHWTLMLWTSLISPLIYAALWSVAALRLRRPALVVPGLVALAGAAAIASVVGQPVQYLAGAIVLALVALLPGAVLARGRTF